MLSTATHMATPHVQDAAAQHGRDLLAAVSGLRNIRLTTMAEQIKQLLHGSLWRDYQLPSGERHTWNGCEFDLFVTAMGFDPEFIVHSARAAGDRQLLLDLAHASDHHDPQRRTVDQIVAENPTLAGRLTPTRLGGVTLHEVAKTATATQAYLDGRGARSAVRPEGQFKVTYRKTGEPNVDRNTQIQAIVRRLIADGLAIDVRAAIKTAGGLRL